MGGKYVGSMPGTAASPRAAEDAAKRQQLVSARVLRREQHPHAEPAELQVLIVAPLILVLDLEVLLKVAGLAGGGLFRQVPAADLQLGDGQIGHDLRGLGKGLLQVDHVRLLSGVQFDQRTVAHAGRGRH